MDDVKPLMGHFVVAARYPLDTCLDLAGVSRALRRLAGRNEGLHPLIAHLSGELGPVA